MNFKDGEKLLLTRDTHAEAEAEARKFRAAMHGAAFDGLAVEVHALPDGYRWQSGVYLVAESPGGGIVKYLCLVSYYDRPVACYGPFDSIMQAVICGMMEELKGAADYDILPCMRVRKLTW